MGFSNQERINYNSAVLQAGVMDANASAVWYEKFFPFTFILDAEQVWTEMALLRNLPAANLAAAQSNAAANPTLLLDLSASANAIRLTAVAGTNNSTWAAYATYNNVASARLRNWILPQLIPRSTGAPSNGYAVQLYDGDPAGSGTLVTTTEGTTGTGINKTVGWIFNFAAGVLLLSDDFKANITNPYILGFRYVGATAESEGGFTVVAGENLVVGNTVRLDAAGGADAGKAFKAQANSVTNADAVGVVAGVVAAGNAATIHTTGKIPVLFGSAPPSADNGKRVYLDPSGAGRGTATLPTASGQAIVQIGRLVGGNGSTTTPAVVLDIRQIAILG